MTSSGRNTPLLSARTTQGLTLLLVLIAAVVLVAVVLTTGDRARPVDSVGTPPLALTSTEPRGDALLTQPIPTASPSEAQGTAEPGAGERVDALDDRSASAGEAVATFELHIQVVDDLGHPVPKAWLEVDAPMGFDELWADDGGRLVLATPHTVEHQLRVGAEKQGPEDEGGYVTAEHRWTPRPGSPGDRLEVVLPREARIVGSLYCTDDSSPRSAGIDIYHIELDSWSNAAAIEDGTFVSGWMPAGDVIIYSRNGSWSDTDLKEREKVTLSCGQSLSYRGALATAIDLKGTVVDTAGRPLADVSVDIFDEYNRSYSESVVSDAKGEFLCDGLYPGGYFLELAASKSDRKTYFTVERGQTSVSMGNLVFRKE